MDPSLNRSGDPEVSAASALERLPHLLDTVCRLWGHSEFELYINRLIMDCRGGTRRGLPWDAAQDLLFLAQLSLAKRALVQSELTGVPFGRMFEKFLADAERNSQSRAGDEDPWTDPRAHVEAGRMWRGRSKPPPMNSRNPSTDSW
jgi:hypothetical protein